MQNLNNSEKTDVLLTALNERYASLRAIRDRIQTICVWALGLMLAAGGWLIQSDITLSPPQKLLYIVGIAVAFIALRFHFLADLYRGFQSQQRTAVRIEKSLGLFTLKIFDEEESSLYPKEWTRAGEPDGEGKFFASTYLLLYIGVGFLVLTILVHAGPHLHFLHI